MVFVLDRFKYVLTAMVYISLGMGMAISFIAIFFYLLSMLMAMTS